MGAGGVEAFEVLAWLHVNDPRHPAWGVGALLFGFGLLGALVTLYVTSPDDLPALGGSAELRRLQGELQIRLRLQCDDLDLRRSLVGREHEAARLAGLKELYHDEQVNIDRLLRQLSAARRSLWRRGIPIFLILGPAAAAIAATTIWQALLVGAAGPSVIAAMVARREYQDRRSDDTRDLGGAADGVEEAVRELDEERTRARSADERVRELQGLYSAAVRALYLLRSQNS